MRVIATIQSTLPGEHPPVDMQWYNGNSLAKAISAMAGCAADHESNKQYTRTLSVRLDFDA